MIVCVLYGAAGVVAFACGDEKDVIALAGGLATGAYLLVCSLLTKEAVGIGDGFVVTAVGIWMGGGKTLAVLMGGFVLAAVFGIASICARKATGKTELAFVPFFTMSYAIFYIGGFL